MTVSIALEHPLTPDLSLLHERHTAAMHAETPPESIHMLPADALAAPGINFYILREAGTPVAMGAFKRLDDSHAEVKSMHVLEEYRGKGFAQMMLDHLVSEARAAGFARLSLETGTEPIFRAAQRFYEKAGFQVCGPFGSYRLDPHSMFMTLTL